MSKMDYQIVNKCPTCLAHHDEQIGHIKIVNQPAKEIFPNAYNCNKTPRNKDMQYSNPF